MARAATTTDAFNAIAEPQRRRILSVLKGHERPVNDLAHALRITPSRASKHLRVLRQVGLVRVRFSNTGGKAYARCEAHLIPAMAEAVRLMDSSLAVLIRAALGRAKVSKQTELILRTLIDFPFWKSLIDAGMSTTQAEGAMIQLVGDQLKKADVR